MIHHLTHRQTLNSRHQVSVQCAAASEPTAKGTGAATSHCCGGTLPARYRGGRKECTVGYVSGGGGGDGVTEMDACGHNKPSVNDS